jgi:mRNA interferase HigB
MRIVTPRRLREYSKRHPDAKPGLLHWYELVKNADWEKLADIRNDIRTVDYVGNNRYVFNIKNDDHRLVVIIIFMSKKIYIRFIGTHADYDKIEDISTI